MLTDEQLQLLQPYFEHEKYGELLKHAVDVWKVYKPSAGLFGIVSIHKKENEDCAEGNDEYIYDNRPGNDGCCLIGAALCNTKMNTRLSKLYNCSEKYNLSIEEISQLVFGFDMTNSKLELPDSIKNIINTEAYKFAAKVGEIVLNNKSVERQI